MTATQAAIEAQNAKNTRIWLCVALLIIAIGAAIITRDFLLPAIFGGMAIAWLVFAQWPKLVMYLVYQTITLAIGYYSIGWIWKALYDNPWNVWLNWLRLTLVVLIGSFIIALAVANLLSAFSGKMLSEEDIGQWTVGGWTPRWGKNQRPWGLLGTFTGIPSSMVNMRKWKRVSSTVASIHDIQTKIQGDPDGKEFEVAVEMEIKWRIVDTLTYLLNTNSVADLQRLLTIAITEWLNRPTQTFQIAADVRAKKAELNGYLRDTVPQLALERYGVALEVKIVDAEKPKVIIDAEKRNALEYAKQQATERQEILDTKGLLEQADMIRQASIAADPANAMSFEKAIEKAYILREKVKKSIIQGTSSRGSRRGGGPGVSVIDVV